jgi:hypothetical protein
MNRTFIVFAGVTSIALALVLSTQISASAKISAPTNPKQPHRLDDRFHETGPAAASIDGTGIMFVDSSFEKN